MGRKVLGNVSEIFSDQCDACRLHHRCNIADRLLWFRRCSSTSKHTTIHVLTLKACCVIRHEPNMLAKQPVVGEAPSGEFEGSTPRNVKIVHAEPVLRKQQ